MAIIDNFFENQDIRFNTYDKINKNDIQTLNDLKETLNSMTNIEQYNLLRKEIEDIQDEDKGLKNSYKKLINENIDKEKIESLITVSSLETEEGKKLSEEERKAILKKIEDIKSLQEENRVVENIRNQNNELKENILKDIENFVDTKGTLNKFIEPITLKEIGGEGSKSTIKVDTLNVEDKIKIISLNYNQKLYNDYSKHLDILTVKLSDFKVKENPSIDEINALKQDFLSKDKVGLFDFVNEQDKKDLLKTFENLTLKKVDLDVGVAKIEEILATNKNTIKGAASNLNETAVNLNSKFDSEVTFDVGMWKQNKEGNWNKENIDLFKDLDLKDAKAIEDKINEIHKNNLLYLNSNDKIQKALDSTRKELDGTLGGEKGPGLFNYMVFPYSLILDLAEASNNIYLAGKNLSTSYQQGKEKAEILNGIKNTIPSFDEKNIIDKSQNKELLLKLSEKVTPEKNLNMVAQEYFEEKIRNEFEAKGIVTNEAQIELEASILNNHLLEFETFKEFNNLINKNAEDTKVELEYHLENLKKMEDKDISNLDITTREDYYRHLSSYTSLLIDESQSYEVILEKNKSQLESLEKQFSDSKNAKLNIDDSFITKSEQDLKNSIDTLKENIKLMEDNKDLFKDFEKESKKFSRRFEEEINNVKNIKSSLKNDIPLDDSNIDYKKLNELSSETKNSEISKENLESISKMNEIKKEGVQKILNDKTMSKVSSFVSSNSTDNKYINEINVTKALIDEKSKDPLTGHFYKTMKDSLSEYEQRMLKEGNTPSIGNFVNEYQLFTPVDFGQEFKDLFEAFLTNYDEMKKAANDLGLDPSGLFSSTSSEQITKLRQDVFAVKEKMDNYNFKSDAIPSEFIKLFKDAEQSKKLGELAKNSLEKGIEDEKERLAKGKLLDDKIEENRLAKMQQEKDKLAKINMEKDAQIKEDKENNLSDM